MGQGLQKIIRGGDKGKDNEAEVTGQALHVRVVAGGSGGSSGDVNIVAVGGNAVTTTVPVSFAEPVSVDDNGGSLTVDGTVTVDSITNPVTLVEPVSVDDNGGSLTVDDGGGSITIDGTVSVTEPVSVDDNGGSLTVDGTVTVSSITAPVTIVEPVTVDTDFNRGDVAGATDATFPAGAIRDDALTTLGDPDGDYVNLRTAQNGALWTALVSATGNAVTITASGALSITSTIEENSAVAAQHNVFPAGVVRDDALGTLGVADNDWTDLRCTSRGATWVTQDRARTSVTSLLSAQVFNNVTTATNSSTFDTTGYREVCVFLQMAFANAPTQLRFIAQFSSDGGTTWFNYAVDQWVDLRYVTAQLPLNEVIPLNYAVPSLMRVRVEATGTDATNTFTVSVFVQAIS